MKLHTSDEMGGNGRNEAGSGYEIPRLQKISFVTALSCKEPAQHIFFSQIDCLQDPMNHVNPLDTDPSPLDPHPESSFLLHTISVRHVPESSILFRTSLDTGKIISSSLSGGKFDNAKVPANLLMKCLDNSSAHDIDTSTKNQPGRDNVETEAATDISVSLCPVTHEPMSEFIISMVGRLVSKSGFKATSLSDKCQKEILSKICRVKITEGIKLLQNCVPCSNKESSVKRTFVCWCGSSSTNSC